MTDTKANAEISSSLDVSGENGLAFVSGAARRRSQLERRTEAEARLLVAARDLLASRGLTGMTLADVGEAAGYSRGLARHHFGSKSGLLKALTLHINRSFLNEMSASNADAKIGMDAVMGYVRVYLLRSDTTFTNTRALLVMLTEAFLIQSDSAEVLSEYNGAIFRYLESHLIIAQQNGEARPGILPKIGAEFIVGALRGILLQRLGSGDVGDTELLYGQVSSLIRHAFSFDATTP